VSTAGDLRKFKHSKFCVMLPLLARIHSGSQQFDSLFPSRHRPNWVRPAYTEPGPVGAT